MLQVDSANAELVPIGPKATAIEGDPRDSCAVLFDDGVVETGIWECTPGAWTSRWDGITEVIHVVAGEATLTDGDGVEHLLVPGTALVMPAGSTGTWRVRETIRKTYAITTVPTA